VARLRPRVLRSLCGARAGGCHPRGHDCGDPLRKGRPTRPFIYCPTGRVGLRLGVSESASCLSGNGRPSRSAPCGPCPVEALAYATGPEGETRRLFRILRFVGSSAPLARRGATALSSAIQAAQSAKRSASRGKRIAASHDALQIRVTAPQDALPIQITGVCTPAIHLTVGKSRRVPPSGPVAQARASTGSGPSGGRPWMAGRFRATGVASKTPRRSPTRPAGQ
jgi:hypothetical protein